MKKYYKVILFIPLVALALWGINYYGHNYSHSEEYLICEATSIEGKKTLPPAGASILPITEYINISRWFYGSHISIRLQNLTTIFHHEECKKQDAILRCFSVGDSGATNLTFNLATNEGKATIRTKYGEVETTNYDLKCELQK
ncbi:hypothetical protein ICN49_05680 [Polynucleobacter sp. MWH-Mekk-B1]|uniref:hypothetical protein n=1 Tax=Polynucleobacter finlandensis TaxID=1855894 RepID=UPI001C0C07B7|nr:hypothetical protein [Polynucleobacter finlandensis]MBU3544406.1 hypothetical protein [Polynucleobacter finlandensis]